MSGSGVDETATPPLRRNRVPHPSAPVTLQGPGLGSHVRVPLGETGFDVFPLSSAVASSAGTSMPA